MSALLSADDLNDFITPGVACIKPADSRNLNKPQQELEIEIDTKGNTVEVSKEGTSTRLEKAQISLADCLACSGCITSAEEVLMAQHSHKEFLSALKEHRHDKTFVASVSHQTRASLATAFKTSVDEIDRMLIKLFVERLGFARVVGTGLGRKIASRRLAQSVIGQKFGAEPFAKPVLSSICPGWVMYVEKTHPFLLPHMDPAKSPQQITGLLLKRMAAKERRIRSSDVYHLSIMPCFDKKLEAARPENDEQVDVDCVITPRELVQLLEDEHIDIDELLTAVREDPAYQDLKSLYEKCAPEGWLEPADSWLNDEGSESGGYAFQYLHELGRYYVSTQGYDASTLDIRQQEGRNTDIYTLELYNTATNKVLGRSAVVNGFRNIQNMVRKIKQGGSKKAGGASSVRSRVASRHPRGGRRSAANNSAVFDPTACDLIEVMACPDGCINGGGQISGPTGPTDRTSAKKWTENLRDMYRSIPLGQAVQEGQLQQWVEAWLDQYTVCDSRLLKMAFHRVEQPKDTTTIALTSTW